MQMSTAIETDNGEMIVKRVSVPMGLEELMEGLTKEVILKKPKDIYVFASQYFAHLLDLREKGSFKGIAGKKAQSATKQISTENRGKLLNKKSKSVEPMSRQLSRQTSIRSESPMKKTFSAKKLTLVPKEDRNEKTADKAKSFLDKRKARKGSKDSNNGKQSKESIDKNEKKTPRSRSVSTGKQSKNEEAENIKMPRQRSQTGTKLERSISNKPSPKKTAQKTEDKLKDAITVEAVESVLKQTPSLSSKSKTPSGEQVQPDNEKETALIEENDEDKENHDNTNTEKKSESLVKSDDVEIIQKTSSQEENNEEGKTCVGCLLNTEGAVDLVTDTTEEHVESIQDKKKINIEDENNKSDDKPLGSKNVEAHLAQSVDKSIDSEKNSASAENSESDKITGIVIGSVDEVDSGIDVDKFTSKLRDEHSEEQSESSKTMSETLDKLSATENNAERDEKTDEDVEEKHDKITEEVSPDAGKAENLENNVHDKLAETVSDLDKNKETSEIKDEEKQCVEPINDTQIKPVKIDKVDNIIENDKENLPADVSSAETVLSDSDKYEETSASKDEEKQPVESMHDTQIQSPEINKIDKIIESDHAKLPADDISGKTVVSDLDENNETQDEKKQSLEPTNDTQIQPVEITKEGKEASVNESLNEENEQTSIEHKDEEEKTNKFSETDENENKKTEAEINANQQTLIDDNQTGNTIGDENKEKEDEKIEHGPENEENIVSTALVLTDEGKTETKTSAQNELLKDSQPNLPLQIETNIDRNDQDKRLKTAKVRNLRAKALSAEHSAVQDTNKNNNRKAKRVKSMDLNKKNTLVHTRSKDKLFLNKAQDEFEDKDVVKNALNVKENKKRCKRAASTDLVNKSDATENVKIKSHHGSFDSSKFHEELKEASEISQQTTFKTSYNPYKLRQEIKEASADKKETGSGKITKIGEITAAIKIQSLWRGFRARKHKTSTSQKEHVMKDELDDENKPEKQVSDENSKDKPDITDKNIDKNEAEKTKVKAEEQKNEKIGSDTKKNLENVTDHPTDLKQESEEMTTKTKDISDETTVEPEISASTKEKLETLKTPSDSQVNADNENNFPEKIVNLSHNKEEHQATDRQTSPQGLVNTGELHDNMLPIAVQLHEAHPPDLKQESEEITTEKKDISEETTALKHGISASTEEKSLQVPADSQVNSGNENDFPEKIGNLSNNKEHTLQTTEIKEEENNVKTVEKLNSSFDNANSVKEDGTADAVLNIQAPQNVSAEEEHQATDRQISPQGLVNTGELHDNMLPIPVQLHEAHPPDLKQESEEITTERKNVSEETTALEHELSASTEEKSLQVPSDGQVNAGNENDSPEKISNLSNNKEEHKLQTPESKEEENNVKTVETLNSSFDNANSVKEDGTADAALKIQTPHKVSAEEHQASARQTSSQGLVNTGELHDNMLPIAVQLHEAHPPDLKQESEEITTEKKDISEETTSLEHGIPASTEEKSLQVPFDSQVNANNENEIGNLSNNKEEHKLQTPESKEEENNVKTLEKLNSSLDNGVKEDAIAVAVLKIQALWRGFKVRKHRNLAKLFGTTVETQDKKSEVLEPRKQVNLIQAVSKIQAFWRGYKVRKNIKEVNKRLEELQKPAECDEMPHQRGPTEEDIFKAASKIQAGVRGYMTRKKRSTFNHLNSIEEAPEEKLSDDQVFEALERLENVPEGSPTRKIEQATTENIERPMKSPLKDLTESKLETAQTDKIDKQKVDTMENRLQDTVPNVENENNETPLNQISESRENSENDSNVSKFITTELNPTTTNKLSDSDTFAVSDDSISNNTVNKEEIGPVSNEPSYEDAPTRPVTSDIIVENTNNQMIVDKTEAEKQNKHSGDLKNIDTDSEKNVNEKDKNKVKGGNTKMLNEINNQLSQEQIEHGKENTVDKACKQARLSSVESSTSVSSVDSVVTVLANDSKGKLPQVESNQTEKKEVDIDSTASKIKPESTNEKHVQIESKYNKLNMEQLKEEIKEAGKLKETAKDVTTENKINSFEAKEKESNDKKNIEEPDEQNETNEENISKIELTGETKASISEEERGIKKNLEDKKETTPVSAEKDLINEETKQQRDTEKERTDDNQLNITAKEEKEEKSHNRVEEVSSLPTINDDKLEDNQSKNSDRVHEKVSDNEETPDQKTLKEVSSLQTASDKLEKNKSQNSDLLDKKVTDNEPKESVQPNKESEEGNVDIKDVTHSGDTKQEERKTPSAFDMSALREEIASYGENLNDATDQKTEKATLEKHKEEDVNKLNIPTLKKEIEKSDEKFKQMIASNSQEEKTQKMQPEKQESSTDISSTDDTKTKSSLSALSENDKLNMTQLNEEIKSNLSEDFDKETPVLDTKDETTQSTKEKLSSIHIPLRELSDIKEEDMDVKSSMDSVADLEEEHKAADKASETIENPVTIDKEPAEVKEKPLEKIRVEAVTNENSKKLDVSESEEPGKMISENEGQNRKNLLSINSENGEIEQTKNSANVAIDPKTKVSTEGKEGDKADETKEVEPETKTKSPTQITIGQQENVQIPAGTTINLAHSGEFHDTVISVSPSQKASAEEEHRASDRQTSPQGLVNTGELHDNVLPVSVQLNEAPPAGAEVLTSHVSKSINNDGQDWAQASNKDASTCETQSDNTTSSPAGMDTEKRNNASIPKKSMESEAATKIQAGFRGYQVRKQLKNKISAPGDISNQRRSARRKNSGRLSESGRNKSKAPSSDIEEKSAVKIQAGVRGFLVRRRQKKQKQGKESS